MNKNRVPQLSKEISYHSINKNEYFIHETQWDHRVKISSQLYDFLQIIDNKKTLETIVVEYNSKYDYKLKVDFCYAFLFEKLAEYGIIINENQVIKPNEKPDYLKLSFIVISEKQVSKFTKYLQFLFLPGVMITILILSIFILSLSFYQFYNQILYSNIAKSEWLTFFLLSFVGVTFHEFGHASAAHYFKAKHGGIGGGFYLFIPVYFADVTDIWKLPKIQRIIVNAAGIYFEIVYMLFLILIGFVFQSQLLIVLSCVISFSVLRNLNPFLRSDGYWILSDAIEKPNLMHHGSKNVAQVFKSKKNWKGLDYFVLFYGLISKSFILFFLYFVLIKNPDSILYFPQNFAKFVSNIFNKNSHFSLAELGKILIPILFFYLVFKWLKVLIKKII
ncbi:peptidase, M50 family protein [Flavobacterium sp. 5]|uniref:peptidase, M50 family protein n=1 Tax=Flavobacterium sp. 5 TaxID=2035199 RepID=UPI000C2C7EBD|nr:peptidase, M50 family protein [Flavobacterium sp. 5]PKB16138.1 putative peptide zinc metalloprotease protein [Flavobacterium sp. 5]